MPGGQRRTLKKTQRLDFTARWGLPITDSIKAAGGPIPIQKRGTGKEKMSFLQAHREKKALEEGEKGVAS